MQNNINYKRKKRKIKNQKKIIVFSSIILGIVVIGALSTQIIFKKNETAKAIEISKTEGDKNSSIVKKEDDKNTSVVKSNLDNYGYLSADEDPVADDAAFVEKYLYQQNKGEMPEGANGHKVAYLTFDDGPSTNVTPEILRILKEKDVKATFFTLGKSINESETTKEILKQQVKDGHAIANHSYSHDYSYLYPNRTVNTDNFMNDIEKSNDALRAVLGKDFVTKVIRFPGGHMSWKGKDAIDEKLKDGGYHYIDWNALSGDAEGKHKSAAELIEGVKKTVTGREKAVILMHDTNQKEETAKALPEIIDYLRSEGYEFRTIK
ncbi:polysaccharide deacetylase family protein [Clostridium weizhouense]|uniref:Polysaccharide deacetylase n=1 Tax=Clostridium weizhouense TaxID=2859781 RepID=A0ABS7AJV3_9CLOT|nr:polysaccharide deacetylase family protein [Clostridium weizhouense]MBW6408950.1 polysaccharide deacetylase [Clostridium weizhouense]